MVCRVAPECCRDTPQASGTHSAGFLWGTAISRRELNSPYPNGVLGVLNQKPLTVPGRFALPFLPAGRPRIAVPYDGIKYFALFSIFFDFFRVEKNVEKNNRQKYTFFALLRFWVAPASIFSRFRSQNSSLFGVFLKMVILSNSCSHC